MAVFCLITTRAADESVNFSEQNYTSGVAVSQYTGTNFTITFDKGTNSNAPKYYSSGTAIRAYGGNTFTVASTTKTITKIEITFGGSDGSNEITADAGTYSNGTWTGSATSVTFTVGGSSGNRRLSAIAVTFQSTTPATTTTYTKVTNISGIVSGNNYVIVYETTPAVSGDYMLDALESVSGSGITLSGSTLTVSSTTSAVPVKITGSKGEYLFQQTNSDAYYICLSGSNISTGNNIDSGYWWSITFDNGNAVVQNIGNKYRYLRYNNTSFVAATSSTGSAVQLYREGTTGDVTPTPAAPTFSPAGGTYTAAQNVTITAASGATIRYTTDGTDPTTSSSLYSSALTVSETTTVKAIAIVNNVVSPIATATYTIEAGSSGGGDEEGAFQLVTDASTLSAGDKIIIANAGTAGSAYAIANTEKSNNRTATAVTVTSDLTIEPTSDTEIFNLVGSSDSWSFQATGTQYNEQYLTANSSTKNYLNYTSTISTAAQATITISNGEASVTFNDTDNRNSMRYNPNNGSPIFSCYASTSNLGKVYLYRQTSSGGGEEPPVTEQVATPVISPGDGTVITGPTSVSISCTTDGATIHYTTDGSTPTSTSETYSAAFNVSATTTVKAIAVKSGMTDSEVASATITYQAPVTNDEYTLVTDDSTLASGDIVIIVSNGAGEVMTAGLSGSSTLAGSSTDVTISSDKSTVTLGDNAEALVLVLEGSSDAWKFRSGSNYLYANSASNSVTMASDNSTQTHTIEIGSDATATIKSGTGSRFLQYNYNNGSTRFGTYASSFAGDNKEVQIYRQAAAASSVTTVTGIAAFKEVTAGETVRLYLPDSYNARVLHATQTASNATAGTYTYDAYVRDNSGAMLIKGLVTTREMAHDQHIAGWLMGQYSTASDGNPQLTPDLCQSSDRTHCPWFVIADPVTETATEPVAVAATEVAGHAADWVKVSNVKVGTTSLTLTNTFNASYNVYNGALVDVSAIATPSAVYPVALGDEPVITHVVDATQAFVSPSSSISDVEVRLAKPFTAGVWTPLTVPFDITEFDGVIMEYIGVQQGDPVTAPSGRQFDAGNMIFEQATSIQAGVPYLVKAHDTTSGMTFSGVTLSNESARSVTHTVNVSSATYNAPRRVSGTDEYTMTGTYSPTSVSTADNSVKVMTDDGSVGWASALGGNVDGSSAYFTTPADQALRIVFDGDSSGTITGINDILAEGDTVAVEGTYNLMGVRMTGDWQSLPAGIYIVNGKKTVKQ